SPVPPASPRRQSPVSAAGPRRYSPAPTLTRHPQARADTPVYVSPATARGYSPRNGERSATMGDVGADIRLYHPQLRADIGGGNARATTRRLGRGLIHGRGVRRSVPDHQGCLRPAGNRGGGGLHSRGRGRLPVRGGPPAGAPRRRRADRGGAAGRAGAA